MYGVKVKIDAPVKEPPITSFHSLASRETVHQTAENMKGLGNFLRSDFLPVDVTIVGTEGRRGEVFSFF